MNDAEKPVSCSDVRLSQTVDWIKLFSFRREGSREWSGEETSGVGVNEIEEHEIVNRRGGSGGGIMRRGCKEKRNYKDYN